MSDTTITLTDEHGNVVPAAAALVHYIRAEVNGAPKWSTYVESFGVTRESVKDHAAALATLAYPNEKPVQKVDGTRTKFGNAVQAAGNGLRRALGKADNGASETDYLARIIKAVESGLSHDVDADTIKAALDALL